MKIINPQSQSNAVEKNIDPALALPFNFLAHLFTIFIDLLINLPAMNAVWRERRELELLNDEHIKDIGLTADAVRQEIERSYFDIPQDRKRSYRRTAANCCNKPYEINQNPNKLA